MNTFRAFAIVAVGLVVGCGDHRVGYVGGIWAISAAKLSSIDLTATEFGSVSTDAIDFEQHYCLDTQAGGGSAPPCYDEPFWDTLSIIRFVNDFPADPAALGAGSLTLTGMTLQLVSSEQGAPAIPAITSTVRETIPAESQRNIVFTLAATPTTDAYSRAANRAFQYVAQYRFTVEGRDPITASLPIAFEAVNYCPEKTRAVYACP